MYDWTIESMAGETVIGSFNNPMTEQRIYEMLSQYKDIFTDKWYTLHLFVGDTEVKVRDVHTEEL